MKAYLAGLYSDPDVGNDIVFAENSKEAMKLAQYLDCTDTKESYVDVYAKRAPEFDGMENASEKELNLKMWREGWYFFVGEYPEPDEATDEEFYELWDYYMGVKKNVSE